MADVLPDRILVFVKAPRPGFTKTRLASQLDPDRAVLASRRLLDRLVANLAELPSLILRYTPDDASAELTTWLKRGWQLEPQESGDLGQRLARAFAHHFAQGAATVLILGSDCPYVERSDLTAATAALQAADVVIGPARDGGYWLIGLKEPHPELFQGVRWSSESVLDETRRRASEAGLHVELLRLLEDVDTLDAWERFEKGERARTIG